MVDPDNTVQDPRVTVGQDSLMVVEIAAECFGDIISKIRFDTSAKNTANVYNLLLAANPSSAAMAEDYSTPAFCNACDLPLCQGKFMSDTSKDIDLCLPCFQEKVKQVLESNPSADHPSRLALSEWAPSATTTADNEGIVVAATTVSGTTTKSAKSKPVAKAKSKPGSQPAAESATRGRSTQSLQMLPCAGDTAAGTGRSTCPSEDGRSTNIGGDRAIMDLVAMGLDEMMALGRPLRSNAEKRIEQGLCGVRPVPPAPNKKVGACGMTAEDGKKCSGQNPLAVAVQCDVCKQWVCGPCYAGNGGPVPDVFDAGDSQHALFVCHRNTTQCSVTFSDFPRFDVRSGVWVARATFAMDGTSAKNLEGITAIVVQIAQGRIDPYSPAGVGSFKLKHGDKVGKAVEEVYARARKRKLAIGRSEEAPQVKRARSNEPDDAQEDPVNEARAILAELVEHSKAKLVAAHQRLEGFDEEPGARGEGGGTAHPQQRASGETASERNWDGVTKLKLTAASGAPFDVPEGPPPAWLKATTKSLRFVVKDFLGSSCASKVMKWLKWAGFSEGIHQIQNTQYKNTCGAVSAKVAHMQAVSHYRGERWWDLATEAACTEENWRKAYAIAFPNKRSNPSTFLSTSHIALVLEYWEAQERTGAQIARAFMLDEAFAHLVKDLAARAWRLKRLAPTEQPFPKSSFTMNRGLNNTFQRLIVNTELNSGKGVHWFNVSYNLVP
jgi:hypothetical protein